MRVSPSVLLHLVGEMGVGLMWGRLVVAPGMWVGFRGGGRGGGMPGSWDDLRA